MASRLQLYFRLFLLIIIFAILFFVFIASQLLDSKSVKWRSAYSNFYLISESSEETIYNETLSADDVQSQKLACKFPYLNAWDPSILQYIVHPPILNCSCTQPYLTFVDMNGILQFNQSELRYLNENNYTNVECFYQTFDRSGHSDVYDTKLELINATVLEKDMVEVNCTARKNDKEIEDFYYNLHAHPTSPQNKTFSKPKMNQLSVLMMIIDSMSLSMMKRTMPLTFEYVTKQMGMIVIESFNKVADNTEPNMMPILTGQRLYPEQDDMPRELTVNSTKGEDLPLIWKEFAKNGYVTVFNEDMAGWSLFGTGWVGDFSKKPVDYFYTPFWIKMEEYFVARGLGRFWTLCFRNIPNGNIFVDLTKRHVIVLKEYLHFMYSMFSYYSHEGDGGWIEYSDKEYLMFWKELFEDGYFNNTFIMFMGDHGHRFSNVRNTLVGLLEERNPFFAVWFPDWFYKLHPRIKSNLLLNRRRLATSFDIHETLKDILNSNYDGHQRNGRGLSLLYPIPVTRTCASAGVPRRYCLCFGHKLLNITTDYLNTVAEGLITALTNLLTPFEQCSKIKLVSIVRAESIEFDELVMVNRVLAKPEDRVRIAVNTHPNNAVFEAVMVKDHANRSYYVDGGIQRLTAYKNTSYCVKDFVLKKYCTCKSAVISSWF